MFPERPAPGRHLVHSMWPPLPTGTEQGFGRRRGPANVGL